MSPPFAGGWARVSQEPAGPDPSPGTLYNPASDGDCTLYTRICDLTLEMAAPKKGTKFTLLAYSISHNCQFLLNSCPDFIFDDSCLVIMHFYLFGGAVHNKIKTNK